MSRGGFNLYVNEEKLLDSGGCPQTCHQFDGSPHTLKPLGE